MRTLVRIFPLLILHLVLSNTSLAACCPWDPKCTAPGDPSFCNSEQTTGTSSYWTQPGSPQKNEQYDGNGVPTGWFGDQGAPPPSAQFQDGGVPNGRGDYLTCQRNREACGENNMACFNAYTECLRKVNPCLGKNPPNYCNGL